jgi:hypothetical protein
VPVRPNGGALMADLSFGSEGSVEEELFLGGLGGGAGGAARAVPASSAAPALSLLSFAAMDDALYASDESGGEADAHRQEGEVEVEAEEQVQEGEEAEEEVADGEEEAAAAAEAEVAAAQSIRAAEQAMEDSTGVAAEAARALQAANDAHANAAADAARAAQAAEAAAAAEAEAARAREAAVAALEAAGVGVPGAVPAAGAQLLLAPGVAAALARLEVCAGAVSAAAAAATAAAALAQKAVEEERSAAAARLKAYVELGVRDLIASQRRRDAAAAYAQAHAAHMAHAALLFRLKLTRRTAKEYRDARFEEDGVTLPTEASARLHVGVCRKLLYGPPPVERLVECPLADGSGITLGSTVLPLRQQLRQTLGSSRYAKGSLVLLGTQADAERAEAVAHLSAPLCCCRSVQQVARGMRMAFEKSGLAEALMPFALSLGKSQVGYFPAVVQMAEDGVNATNRTSVDPSTIKPAYLAPWAQNNAAAVLLGGLNGGLARLKYMSHAEDGRAKNMRYSAAVEAWGEQQWLFNYYEASGMREIHEWDVRGPLLLPEIPGLKEEDGQTLWVTDPAVAGGSLGDMMGLQKTCGLKRFRCPRCEVVPAFHGALDKGGARPRSEPSLAAEVAGLYAAKVHAWSLPDGPQKADLERRVAAGLSARGLADVLPGYAHASSPTLRLPWTLPGSTPFLSRCIPDALHLFKVGLFKYVPACIIKLCESLGTFTMLSKAFVACTKGAFTDSVRTKVTFNRSGIAVSQQTLSGPSREWVMRTIVAALRACPACIPDAAQHTRVLRAAEDMLLVHHISTRLLAEPTDRQYLHDVLLPRLFTEGLPELGHFQDSNFEIPKVHQLTELCDAMHYGGSLSNWSMECVEGWNKLYLKVFAFHTSGGVAALHQQVPLRYLEHQFYEHDLWTLRGMRRPPLEFTVPPQPFSQEVNKWDKPGAQPSPQLIALWGAAPAASLHPVVLPGHPPPPPPPPLAAAPHFLGVAGLKFTRSVFGLPISSGIFRPGTFVRPTSSRAYNAPLYRISLLFFHCSSDKSMLKTPGLPPEHLPLYFVAEVWRADGANAFSFTTQVRRDSGERVVGLTASLFGLALTWSPRGLGLRGAVLYDPGLERY